MRTACLGKAGASVSGREGAKDAGVFGEGLGGGVEDGERALFVAGGGGLIGAADGPVGPDGLDGATLFVGEILPAAEQHELAIETGVVGAVEEQPGVLDVDVGGGGGVLPGVVLLDAADEDGGLARLAEGVVDGADGLEVFGIVFELEADLLRNLLGLGEGFAVPVGSVEDGEETLPGVGAVGALGEYLAVDGVGLLRVVAGKVDARELELEGGGGLLVGGGLLADGSLEDLLGGVEPV